MGCLFFLGGGYQVLIAQGQIILLIWAFRVSPEPCVRAVPIQTPPPLKPWKRSSPLKPGEPQNARSAQNPPPRPTPCAAGRLPDLLPSPPPHVLLLSRGQRGATGPPPGPPASPRTTSMGPLPPSAGRSPHLPMPCPISWLPCAPWTRRKS
jgi:hypothetical protein